MPSTSDRSRTRNFAPHSKLLLVTAAEMRELDRLTIEKYGTPGRVLMERAGAGATRMLLEVFPHLRRRGKRVVVCAGKGNNGGDGFVIARLLRRRGARAEVFLFGRAGEVKGDAALALKAFERGRGRIVEVVDVDGLARLHDALGGADAIVDALFGTGLNQPVSGLQAEAIELLNASGVPTFAVDIPSGLNADTGQPLGVCVQSEATATFGFAKVGQVIEPGASLVGGLGVIDIGIAEEAVAERPPRCELVESADMAALVPTRRRDAHKGDCGHVLVIAGSFGKTGAPQLVSRAASRAGAGLVTLVGPQSLYAVYAAGVLEAMTEVLPDRDGRVLFEERALSRLLEGKNAVVIGPGLGTHEDAARIVRWFLGREGLRVVLDADATTCIAGDLESLKEGRASCVLTPHPGEMARLIRGTTADVQSDRVGVARRFAVENRCTLVLKGAGTITADPSGYCWINSSGNPGMASGGMGDALAGIIGSLLAQGLAPSEAARLGVYAHGVAADRVAARRGEIGLLASDVIEELSFRI